MTDECYRKFLLIIFLTGIQMNFIMVKDVYWNYVTFSSFENMRQTMRIKLVM